MEQWRRDQSQYWVLRPTMDKYEMVKDLGAGNIGVARLMRHKDTKELVAMKYIERGPKIDVSSLVSQLKDLQRKNEELEELNKKLSYRLQTKEAENDIQQKHLSNLEHCTIPSLRKALRDVAMEKDAAVVAREDLSAQIRSLKKRLLGSRRRTIPSRGRCSNLESRTKLYAATGNEWFIWWNTLYRKFIRSDANYGKGVG